MESNLWSNVEAPYRCFEQPTAPLLMAHIHTDEDFPVSVEATLTTLALPIYREMTQKEIKVCP